MATKKTDEPARTAEDAIRERAKDPAALASGITITGNGTRLVFHATPGAPRLSLRITGDEISVE